MLVQDELVPQCDSTCHLPVSSLLNEQQERFFSISASLRGAPSLEAIKNSQTVGNCQLTKLFSQQQRQGGRRGAGEVAGGGREGGLQSCV
ncbi:hypothetical protein QQF64_014868 [Cirrhinus molitorella]|uniref:Uncharacterized protein n=1 Tax=Cirrhinus molitorella TaxID=172907 RepID=A0ABR3NUB7_9TELE